MAFLCKFPSNLYNLPNNFCCPNQTKSNCAGMHLCKWITASTDYLSKETSASHHRKKIPEKYAFTVGKRDKDYISYETLFQYMCNSFNNWLNDHDVTRSVIVWTYWHQTMNNYFLAKTLNEPNIILYGPPLNTTHFLQPLDASVFGPLKKERTRAVKEWEQEHTEEILKVSIH